MAGSAILKSLGKAVRGKRLSNWKSGLDDFDGTIRWLDEQVKAGDENAAELAREMRQMQKEGRRNYSKEFAARLAAIGGGGAMAAGVAAEKLKGKDK